MPLIHTDEGGIILDEEEESLPVYSQICSFCAHQDEGGARRCSAFPGGIPLPIWLGENDHRQPYAGDHGIQFEEWKEAASEAPEAVRAEVSV